MIGAGDAMLASWFILSLLILHRILQTELEKAIFLGANLVLAMAAAATVIEAEPAFAAFYLGMGVFYVTALGFLVIEMMRKGFEQ
jgi:3-polyprenyl-4-hydroxybenzoate decarboxylase